MTFSRTNIISVLIAVAMGFVIGLAIQYFLTGSKMAPLICAMGAGIGAMAKQRATQPDNNTTQK